MVGGIGNEKDTFDEKLSGETEKNEKFENTVLF